MDRSRLPYQALGWLLLGALAVSLPFELLAAGKKSTALDIASDSDADDSTTTGTKIETPLIGEYITYAGLQPLTLEGVGLVVNLKGTGDDPAPSYYRTMLLEDMKKRQIADPNKLIRSPDTALVVIRTYLPVMMAPGEALDVEVRVPDSSNAQSLAGGYLMECDLVEQGLAPGRGPIRGHIYGKARGPILVKGVAMGAKLQEAALLQRGVVLGGGKISRKRELSIFLRSDARSVRNAIRISDAIGKRFHDFNEHGSKQSMAVPKTDQKITLTVHPTYADNYPRYLQVIRHIAFREEPVARRVRMQRLAEKLQQPDVAEKAAMELEAIGTDAIPVLKTGLKAPTLECQFYSAVSLAYLEDPSGIPVLLEAAKKERAFRVFALAALSSLEDASASLGLRELMNENSAETRYGAFRALYTADRKDPFIRGEPMLDGQYFLHVLETQGEPMVHVTLHTRPEVVVFGRDQEFVAPMVLSAGRSVMVTAQPGDRKVSVARFEPGKADRRQEVSLRVADVVRAAAEMGASYPDIVQMLAEADRQKNLPGRLAMDALPEAGRFYERPNNEIASSKLKKAKIGRLQFSPGLFPFLPGEGSNPNNAGDDSADPYAGETSAQLSVLDKAADDAAAGKTEEPRENKKWFGLFGGSSNAADKPEKNDKSDNSDEPPRSGKTKSKAGS